MPAPGDDGPVRQPRERRPDVIVGPAPDDPVPGVGTGAVRRTLTRSECLERLSAGGRGRVAATMRAVPIIVPVTFVFEDEAVVFSTGRTEGLARAVANAVVVFECDDLGTSGDGLWGVHVTGVARVAGDPAAGPRFRLGSEYVSGWRVGD